MSTTTADTSTLQANAIVVSANNVNNTQCLAFIAKAVTEPSMTHNITRYADSAASHHFFTDKMDFIMYDIPSSGDMTRLIAKGGEFKIYGCRRVQKWVQHKSKIMELMFENMLHASVLMHNLILVELLVQKSIRMEINGKRQHFLQQIKTILILFN